MFDSENWLDLWGGPNGGPNGGPTHHPLADGSTLGYLKWLFGKRTCMHPYASIYLGMFSTCLTHTIIFLFCNRILSHYKPAIGVPPVLEPPIFPWNEDNLSSSKTMTCLWKLGQQWQKNPKALGLHPCLIIFDWLIDVDHYTLVNIQKTMENHHV